MRGRSPCSAATHARALSAHLACPHIASSREPSITITHSIALLLAAAPLARESKHRAHHHTHRMPRASLAACSCSSSAHALAPPPPHQLRTWRAPDSVRSILATHLRPRHLAKWITPPAPSPAPHRTRSPSQAQKQASAAGGEDGKI
eukprot:3084376-Rhodomonas_salina.1